MKNVVLSSYGKLEVSTDSPALKLSSSTDSLIDHSNCLLIKILAVALLPVDVAISKGQYKGMTPISPPFTPGTDFYGLIVEIGESVQGFTVGDEVLGISSSLTNSTGPLAELTIQPYYCCMKKPSQISMTPTQAITFLSPYLVIYTALHEQVTITSPSSSFILINNASSTYGFAAVHYCLSLKMRVLAVVNNEESSSLFNKLDESKKGKGKGKGEEDEKEEERTGRLRLVIGNSSHVLKEAVDQETRGLGVHYIYDPDICASSPLDSLLPLLRVFGKLIIGERSINSFQLDPFHYKLLHRKSATLSWLCEQSWLSSPIYLGKFAHYFKALLSLLNDESIALSIPKIETHTFDTIKEAYKAVNSPTTQSKGMRIIIKP